MEIEVKITKDGDTKRLKIEPLKHSIPRSNPMPFLQIEHETIDIIGEFGIVEKKPTGFATIKIFGQILKGE